MWTNKSCHASSVIDPCIRHISKYFQPDLLSRKAGSLRTRINIQNNNIGVRNVSTRSSKFIPFESMIHDRRLQAQKSILVQVQSEKSCNDLFAFASQFGTVENMFHYTLPGHNHFVLVEMKDQQVIKRIMNKCGHLDKSQVIPVRSPFLWFRANKNKNIIGGEQISNVGCKTHCLFPPSEEQVKESLLKCENLSNQITTLYEMTKMNEINARLRFLVAYQVELALSGLFPLCIIYPFGSSVNYFGKLGCDLDLVLQLDKQSKEESEDSRLMFHCKTSLGSERSQTLRHLETVGDLLQLFLPGCSHVKRILGARVPIIKYNHEMAALECDLSMTNMTALYMAELLFIFGEIDWRVRPLVFTIKKWAKDVNLTNPSPGRWITNFSLTILILFYLQSIKLIPSIKGLVDQSSAKDKRVSEDGVDCTFLRDISRLKFTPSISENSIDSLSTLLLGFFEFYSQFDFHDQGISLYLGASVPKPEYCSLYINNPLERGLNVSKNVSQEELERIKLELRNGAWALESTSHSSSPTVTKSTSPWGLLELFKKQDLSEKARKVFFNDRAKMKERLVTVEELFTDLKDSPVIVENVNVNMLEEEDEKTSKKRRPLSPQTIKAVQKHLNKRR